MAIEKGDFRRPSNNDTTESANKTNNSDANSLSSNSTRQK